MFVKRGDAAAETVTIYLDGAAIQVPRGKTLAAVLLARGLLAFGTTAVSGAPRGPYCLIGHCFGCLIEVEGRGDQRACQIPVREDLKVWRRPGLRDPAA